MSDRLHRVPLGKQVVNLLRREILPKLKPGDRLEPLTALAKRFSVSVLTVREAISALVQEGLVEKRHGSGIYVTDHSQRQHVAIVLGIHPMTPHFTFCTFRILEQLHFFFNQRGLRVHTYWAPHANGENAPDPAHDELAENLAGGRVSGIVLARGPLNARWKTLLTRSGLPVVRQEHVQSVEQGYGQMIRAGARFLVESGRRNLAMLFGSDPWDDPSRETNWKETARQTFLETLNSFGAQSRDSWIRGDFRPNTPGAGYEQFKEIWMAGEEKPDGLLICDDHLFLDAAIAILEIGIRVPDQLMVVTQANKDSGMLYPFPTARMECDIDFAAQSLGRLLIKRIRNEPIHEPRARMPFRWVGAEAVLSRANPSRAVSPTHERKTL